MIEQEIIDNTLVVSSSYDYEFMCSDCDCELQIDSAYENNGAFFIRLKPCSFCKRVSGKENKE